MIKFKATEEQVRQIAANAVNASPMGLGFLHYRDVQYGPEDIKNIGVDGLYIDYFEGRMVKLFVKKYDDGTWGINENPRADYQSWVVRYPSTSSLIMSVGGVTLT